MAANINSDITMNTGTSFGMAGGSFDGIATLIVDDVNKALASKPVFDKLINPLLVGSSAVGTANTVSGTTNEIYVKIATLDLTTGSDIDGSVLLGIQSNNGNEPLLAEIVLSIRQGTDPTMTADVVISGGFTSAIGDVSFNLNTIHVIQTTTGVYEVYWQKELDFHGINVFQFGQTLNAAASLVYFDTQAFVATLPASANSITFQSPNSLVSNTGTVLTSSLFYFDDDNKQFFSPSAADWNHNDTDYIQFDQAGTFAIRLGYERVGAIDTLRKTGRPLQVLASHGTDSNFRVSIGDTDEVGAVGTAIGGSLDDLLYLNEDQFGLGQNASSLTPGLLYNFRAGNRQFKFTDGINTYFDIRKNGSDDRGLLRLFDGSGNATILLDGDGAAVIGDSSVTASAAFEINSTTKAFLPTRMTRAQRDAITGTTPGLVTYQTDESPGYYVLRSSGWGKLDNAPFKTLFTTAGNLETSTFNIADTTLGVYTVTLPTIGTAAEIGDIIKISVIGANALTIGSGANTKIGYTQQFFDNEICVATCVSATEWLITRITNEAINYEATFVITDWVVGTPNTLTIPESTHNLGQGLKHVTVFDASDNVVVVSTNVNQTSGVVTLSTTGATFDGKYYIS
jgi:hypothetical protein